MNRLISSTTMPVDVVTDVGEWYVAEGGHHRAARELFEQAAAMLLGRKTYEGLAAYWSPLKGEWANCLKFVASRTLRGPLEWNARLLEGEVAEVVPKLKDELDGDLILIGCGELARHLLAAGAIDELRFWVHPGLGGRGPRPSEGDTTVRLRFLDSSAFDSGVALLRYEPVE